MRVLSTVAARCYYSGWRLLTGLLQNTNCNPNYVWSGSVVKKESRYLFQDNHLSNAFFLMQLPNWKEKGTIAAKSNLHPAGVYLALCPYGNKAVGSYSAVAQSPPAYGVRQMLKPSKRAHFAQNQDFSAKRGKLSMTK